MISKTQYEILKAMYPDNHYYFDENTSKEIELSANNMDGNEILIISKVVDEIYKVNDYAIMTEKGRAAYEEYTKNESILSVSKSSFSVSLATLIVSSIALLVTIATLVISLLH